MMAGLHVYRSFSPVKIACLTLKICKAEHWHSECDELMSKSNDPFFPWLLHRGYNL